MRRVDAAPTLDAAQTAAADRGIKAMIPDSRGRPFLDHVLSSLADAGITDVCLVIGPDHDLIRHRYSARPPRRLRIAFAVQHNPTGTADALLCAEAWAAGREHLVLNADNLYPIDAIRALMTLDGPGLVAFDRDALVRESNIDPARIGAFAIVAMNESGLLTEIVEKPGADYLRSMPPHAVSRSPLVSMNIWRFDTAIFAACRDVPLSPRGEHELPLAVALGVARGMQLRGMPLAAGVLDLSNRGDIAGVARSLGARTIEP